MNDTAYSQPTNLGIVNHFQFEPVLLRDEDDSVSELLMQARIRSGDYIPTLATELDRLAVSLRQAGSPEAVALDRLVTELLYLDKHYLVDLKTKH